MKDIDVIAVANGPGLVGALLIGTMVAKTIGMVMGKKIVSVNHLEGHIFSSFLFNKNDEKKQETRSKKQVNSKFHPPIRRTNSKQIAKKRNIIFPMMVLIVSGGHTEIILMEDYGVYKTIGSTIDDAAGEAFDKAAKILGLPYPGGPSIASEAGKVSSVEIPPRPPIRRGTPPILGGEYIDVSLPRPMINSDDYNFSFSGLKTALLYETQKIKNVKLKIKDANKKLLNDKINSKGNSLTDVEVSKLAYEFQEAVVEVLVKKTKRAMKEYGVNRLAVVGGVAANSRLREKIYEEIEGEIMIPEFKYCTDNGVKIAVAGYYKYMRKEFVKWQDLEVKSNWEL
jgi:N6-L-threonylcarbamoyladenine synthase